MAHLLNNKYYEPPSSSLWRGRVDGNAGPYRRWHQVMECLNLLLEPSISSRDIVLLGFCSDEGVRRNLGRVGAAKGPMALRRILSGLPVHHNNIKLHDAGNIYCRDRKLEESQKQLSVAVASILKNGGFPVLLGGGHEVAYGHFKGVYEAFGADRAIGIINFDAHFDLREPIATEASSGTGFFQIAQELSANNQQFHYLALGIQQISNTRALFDTAQQLGVDYIDAESLNNPLKTNDVLQRLDEFIGRVDVVYLTVDLDVFSAAYAPGVSAPAFCGIAPDYRFFPLFDRIFKSGKLKSMDIAELNPDFDIDDRTVKLAADLIFRALLHREM